MAVRNNVTRYLDSLNLPYQAYELPRVKLGAQETAELLGVQPEIVFKTIVVTTVRPGKPLLVLVPGTAVVDLKLVALAVAAKKVHLATQREAEAITGLQVGGISPLALINRGFNVLVDETARSLGQIHVSGARGVSTSGCA
jgi:Cys-tRNA(Pro)/Cys-tRNA(Cys) deacylase